MFFNLHSPSHGTGHKPGTCPDWELNQQPLGSQANAQSTKPHQPGLPFLKGFSELERNQLAMLTDVLPANRTLNASILNGLYSENLVKGFSSFFQAL